MQKLKIAIMGDAVDQEVLEHVLFLSQKGHDVRFYSTQKPLNNSLPAGILFKKLSAVSYPFTYFTFVFTAPHMLSHRPDIIHAFNLADYGVLGSLFARLTGIKPLVLTAKGQDILHDAKTRKGWAIKHMMPLASLFLSRDETALQEMIKMGAPINKTRVLNSKYKEQLDNLEKDCLELTTTKRYLKAAKAEKISE